jgi:outer membrane biosynthesis protein TonB
MRRLVFFGLTMACLAAGDAQAQYPNQYQNDAPPPFVGQFLNGILRSIPAQPPQTEASPQQAQPQQGYVQQPSPQPNPKGQQQIEEEHRQAAAAAEERVKRRQQAEADARAKLHQADLKAMAEAKAKASAEARKNREAIAKLRAAPALVAALGSDPQDITALIVGKDTSTVIRDLDGKPAFQSAPVVACFPFGGLTTQPGSSEMRFLSDVMADIAKKGGLSGATVIPKVCDPSDIRHYDLVIFSSGQVAAADSPEVLSALVNALVSGRFVTFGTFTVADFDAKEDARIAAAQATQAKKEAERQEAIENFEARDPALISAIYFQSPATVVCLMAPDAEGVRYLFTRGDSPFAGLVDKSTAVIGADSANGIFIAMKKHVCFAAVAPAGALKKIVAAFARENVPVQISGGYITNEQLANWKILKEQELLVEQAAQASLLQKQREINTKEAAEEEDKQALEAERQKNDEAVRQQKIQEMRRLVGSKANAVVDGFVGELRTYMTTIHDRIAAHRPPGTQVFSIFEPWADQFATQIEEGWAFQPVSATVEDYGRAVWKDRTIEAISIQVEFPMLNRVIGEKRTACVDFVWINDEEFGFWRNPTTMSCNEYGPAFKVWSEQNRFTSQWTLLQ